MVTWWPPAGVPTSGPANLIVAGGFSQIGGQNIPRMARWDGTWHDIGWIGSSGGVPYGLARSGTLEVAPVRSTAGGRRRR